MTEQPVAVTYISLQPPCRRKVDAIRILHPGRPVYYRRSDDEARVISGLDPGTPEYGQAEQRLLSIGFRVVLGSKTVRPIKQILVC